MHLRYPRAAIAAESSSSVGPLADIFPTHQAGTDVPRPQVLWASPALPTRAGRLVGVRRNGQAVQVALIKHGEDRLRWVAAESVLTEFQAMAWVQTSQFFP